MIARVTLLGGISHGRGLVQVLNIYGKVWCITATFYNSTVQYKFGISVVTVLSITARILYLCALTGQMVATKYRVPIQRE